MFGRIAPMGTGSFEFAFHIRYYQLPVQSMLAAQIYGWTTATVPRKMLCSVNSLQWVLVHANLPSILDIIDFLSSPCLQLKFTDGLLPRYRGKCYVP